MSSLQMLQSLYDSSDSDIEETDLNNVAKKLPFPKQIETIITNPDEAYNDPTKHQGRFRSFKHKQGNWATYVCLPYEQTFSPDLKKCVESTFDKTQVVKWFVVDRFHVSLSRTVAIPHHFIEPLVQLLQEQFRDLKRFLIQFAAADMRFYVNDDHTRSFCGMEILDSSTQSSIKKIIRKVDEAFAQYRCESFYKEASYHISFAWCLGDILKNQRCNEMLDSLKKSWSYIENNNEHLFSFQASEIFLKSGNKCFTFKLT